MKQTHFASVSAQLCGNRCCHFRKVTVSREKIRGSFVSIASVSFRRLFGLEDNDRVFRVSSHLEEFLSFRTLPNNSFLDVPDNEKAPCLTKVVFSSLEGENTKAKKAATHR